MRNFIDASILRKSVKNQIRKMILTDEQVLSSNVMNNSNFHFSEMYFYSIKYIKLDDFIRLAISSWYIPEEAGVVLRMDLEEKMKNFSLEDQILLKQFLNSEVEMILFLLQTQIWHTRDFFGNLLDGKTKLDKYLQPNKPDRRITFPERKRGYHDHGSLRPVHCWKPTSDWSLTKLQQEIEQKRKSHEDTLDFIRGCLI